MKSISFYLKYTRLKAKILCSQGLNFLIYQVYLICIYQSFTPRNTLQLQQKKIVAVLNVLIATRFPLALMFSTFYLFPFALVFLNQNAWFIPCISNLFCKQLNKVTFISYLIIPNKTQCNALGKTKVLSMANYLQYS